MYYSGLSAKRKIDGIATDGLVKVILSWGAQRKWASVGVGRVGKGSRYQSPRLRSPGGREMVINLVTLKDRKRQAQSKLDLERPILHQELRTWETKNCGFSLRTLKPPDHIVFKWSIIISIFFSFPSSFPTSFLLSSFLHTLYITARGRETCPWSHFTPCVSVSC